MSKDNEKLRSLLTERAGQVDELSSWGKSLQDHLEDRDRLIIESNSKIEEVSKDNEKLRNFLIERDREIDELFGYVKKLENNLNSRDTALAEFDSKFEELSSENKKIQSLLDERTTQINLQDRVIIQLKLNAEKLLNEKNTLALRTLHQQSELMWLSDWAEHINSNPIRYGVKKLIYQLARSIYRALPLNMAGKYRLRQLLMRITKSASSENKPLAVPAHGQDQSGPISITGSIAPKEKGRDVFVFSVIDWHFRIQRPQQLARGFAKTGGRVFFFSNHFVDSNVPGYEIEQLDPKLPLYQIKLHVEGAPAIYFDPPTEKAQANLELSIAKFILDYGVVSTVTIIQHAYWYPLVCHLPNTYRVYDCMDHHEGFGNVPEKLIEIEKDMLKRSDMVVVTSTWLERLAKGFNQNVAVIRNACEYEHFSQSPADVFKDPSGRKIIGYYGAIAEWFDIEIVRAIAVTFPTCLVLLVGNDTVQAGRLLSDLPNVMFTGEVPYAKLPYYLYSFDVCLLPFKVIPLTLATNPVKIYEYLAAGKAVVSVDLPEIVQFGGLVRRAATLDDFVSLVGEEIEPKSVSDSDGSSARRTFAAEQTWDHRVAELNGALAINVMPRISVVVLTYNNLHLTQACLTSLVEETHYSNLEIVIVDNASSDGTVEYLREFGAKFNNVKVILNDDNVGFSAGNNVGLAAASGDYLVILNNDTVVTPGWASTLMRHLQADSSVGLIGPVTNNIGNEARIDTTYKDIALMPLEARNYTLSNMGKIFAIKNVAFFCVMMPRSTYERCGNLCEEYGLGFFEDDDYCRRVEAAGLRIVCAEDVFIHHHLSASFNKLGDEKRRALVEKNKAIYEKKWGEWVPHSYRKTDPRTDPA